MLGLNPNLCKVKLHLRAFEVIPWKPSLVKACCTYVGWAIPFLRITGGRLERAVWLAFGPHPRITVHGPRSTRRSIGFVHRLGPLRRVCLGGSPKELG